MTLLSTALRYQSEGLVVLPVRARVKGPVLNAWQDEKEQTPTRVRELFHNHEGNIGLLCGAASRLLVVDVDVKFGKVGATSVAEWEAAHGTLPRTRTHATPSGGLHLLYRLPPGRSVKSTRKLMRDVDIQGDGAQVLAPPSVLVGEIGSGGRPQVPGPYDLIDDAPIADCPPALLSQLDAAAGPRKINDSGAWDAVTRDDPTFATRLALQLEGFAKAPIFREGEGQGNVRYVMMFQRLGPGLSLDFDTTLASYIEAYEPRLPPEHRWLPNCAIELRHTLARAYERPMDKGYEPDQMWQEHLTVAELEAQQAPALEGLPSFPVHTLPPVLRAFVLAEAERTQTPVDLAAMLVLGACAASVAGKYDVEIEAGYLEPLNIFAIAVMGSAERKTPVFKAVFAPIVEAERIRVKLSAPVRAMAEARLELAQKLLSDKKKAYGKVSENAVDQVWDGPKEKGGVALAREIEEQAARVAALEVPVEPRLLCDDVTPEKLAMLLGEHHGRMCVASDEASIFKIIAGRYSKDGAGSFEVFLQGYAGTPLRVDRQSRPSVFVANPRLTLTTTVQPEIMAGLGANKDMRGQGLLARIFYSFPKSRVGARAVVTPPMDPAVERDYHTCITKLLSLPNPEEVDAENPRIPRLQLSNEAREMHRALRARLEPRLAGDLADMRDWAGKLAGGVGRIASALSIVEHGADVSVAGTSMAAAIEIGETYLLPHAAHAFDVIGTTETKSDADALAMWLEKSKLKTFTLRDAKRLGPKSLRNDKVRLDVAIRELVDRGDISGVGPWTVAQL